MTDIVDITTASTSANNATFLFTSESVGEGHPGEICEIPYYHSNSLCRRSALKCGFKGLKVNSISCLCNMYR